MHACLSKDYAALMLVHQGKHVLLISHVCAHILLDAAEMRRPWRSTPARPAISELRTRYSSGHSEPHPTRRTPVDACTSGSSKEADIGSARSAASAAAESQHMTMRWDAAASDSEPDGTPSGHAAPSPHRSPFGSSGRMQHATAELAESRGGDTPSARAHGGCAAAVQGDAKHAEAGETGQSDGSLEHTACSGSAVRQLPVRPARASAAVKPSGKLPDVSAVLTRTRARAGRAQPAAEALAMSKTSSRAPAHAAGVVSPFAAVGSSRAAQGAEWGLRPLTSASAGAAEAGAPLHGSGDLGGGAEFPRVHSGQSVASAVSAACEANGEGSVVRAAAANFWAAAADEPHRSSVRRHL